jgi:hypothetical protein
MARTVLPYSLPLAQRRDRALDSCLASPWLDVGRVRAPIRQRTIAVLDIGSFVDQRSGDFRVFDRLGNLEKDGRLPNDVVFTRHNTFPDTPGHITRKSDIRSGGTV